MSFSIKNKNDCFYDAGFDFRFSENGTEYLAPKKLSFNERIYEITSKFVFFFKAHFFSSKEEKKVRQGVLQCAKAEKFLSKCSVEWLNKGNEKYAKSFIYGEHDFFEKIGQLYKGIFSMYIHNERPFPNELLLPIHLTNKNQSTWTRKEHWNNEGNIPGNVIAEFKSLVPMFPLLNAEKDFENKVDHYEFCKSFEEQEKILKEECRNLRRFLYKSTTDYKNSSDYRSWKYKLETQLTKFSNAWRTYSLSHPLIHDAGLVLSDKDHYAGKYSAFKKSRNAPNETGTVEGNKSVIDLYKTKFPHTNSGKYHNQSGEE